MKFIFPESEAKYWLLLWIGNPIFERRAFRSTLYFFGTKTNTDNIQLQGGESNFVDVFEVTIPTQNALLVSPGNIYSTSGDLIKTVKNFNRSGFSLRVNTPVASSDFQSINHEGIQNFVQHSSFPLFTNEDFLDSRFIVKRMDMNKKDVFYIVPMFVVFQYFYGISTNVSQLLLKNRISQIFDLNDVELAQEKDKRVLTVKYDNRKISAKEMGKLLLRLLPNITRGYQCLNYVGANVISQFINGKEKAIFNVELPFIDDFVFGLEGKYLGDHLFMSYRIKSINLKDNQPAFDEIKLIKKHPDKNKPVNDKQPEDEMVDRIVIKNSYPKTTKLVDNPNAGANPGPNTIVKDDQNHFDFDMDIDITTEYQDNEENPGTEIIVLDEEFEGLNTNIDGLEVDPENLYTNFLFNLGIVERHIYIEELMKSLENRKEIDGYRYIRLSQNHINEIGFIKEYGKKAFEIIIVEIQKSNHYFYLIEFSFGRTELVNFNDPYFQIDPPNLNLLINKFLKHYLDYKGTKPKPPIYNKNSENKRYIELPNKDLIYLFPGIEHPVENFNSFESKINHTRGKVMNRMKSLIKVSERII